MIVQKIDREKPAEVVVSLNYGDVRDISNLLYFAETEGKLNTEEKLQLRIDFSLLFDMLKNGRVDYFHTSQAKELYEKSRETPKED